MSPPGGVEGSRDPHWGAWRQQGRQTGSLAHIVHICAVRVNAVWKFITVGPWEEKVMGGMTRGYTWGKNGKQTCVDQ